MLGFSVYLGHDLTSEDYNYLLTMRNSGFAYVFTQLVVADTAKEIILKRLNNLTNWCQDVYKRQVLYWRNKRFLLLNGHYCRII